MRRTTKILFFLFLILLILGGFFGFAKNILAVSPTIVINEIQISGGTGKTENDFVEIYNLTDASINLKGYRLVKRTAAGTSDTSIKSWDGDTIVASQDYYLWANSKDGFAENIKADGATSETISNNNGIAIRNGAKDTGEIVDSIGWGDCQNIFIETAVFPQNPSANKSIERKNFADSDNNALDFFIQEIPSPTHSKPLESIPDPSPLSPPEIKNYSGKLKINEIFPAPKDKNAGKEFMEIINTSTENINLSGMRIEDEKNHKVYFPEKILVPGEITYLEGNFELNNTTPDTAFLIGKDGTRENPIDSVSYTNPKYDYAYAFNGSAWQWTSRETKGAENQFDELLSGQIKKDKTIYADIYADFEVKTDAKAEHFTWNFGDGHKSYLKKTRHKYEDSGIYLVSLKLTGEGEDNLLNFEVEVIEYPTPKIKIVKIKANPKGKDTDGEEIYLKNNSKKKINLKTWSLATGDKNLYNHPITKDFIIQPGKTKKITHKYSLFTLNNKKGAIELRYPNGEVASRVKYDKKKESVKDDEVYELAGKNWQWDAPLEESAESETAPIPKEITENIEPAIEPEISEEEISLNLGKYSTENKLALAEIGSLPNNKNLLQSRETPGIVLGAFSSHNEIHRPIEIKSVNYWQKTLQKSNQLFNFLINRFIRLI